MEVTAAIARRNRNSGPDFARFQLSLDWDSLIQLPLTEGVMERAVVIARRFRLRGADAIHLSAVDLLRSPFSDVSEPVVLLTSDQEMLEAAITFKISTARPCNWPAQVNGLPCAAGCYVGKN